MSRAGSFVFVVVAVLMTTACGTGAKTIELSLEELNGFVEQNRGQSSGSFKTLIVKKNSGKSYRSRPVSW